MKSLLFVFTSFFVNFCRCCCCCIAIHHFYFSLSRSYIFLFCGKDLLLFYSSLMSMLLSNNISNLRLEFQWEMMELFFSFSRTDWITKWKAVFHRFYCMWLPRSMCTCTWVCVNGLCFLLRQMFIWLLAPLSSSCSTLFLSFDSNQYSYEEKRKHTRSHSQRKIFTLQMIYVMFSSSSLKTTAHFMYWHRSIIRFEHRKGTMEMKMIYCNWCTHMFLKVWSLLWIS